MNSVAKCDRCGQANKELADVDGGWLCPDCTELYNRECVYGENHGFGVRIDFGWPARRAKEVRND